MARHLHNVFFRHLGQGHVTRCGAAEIVKMVIGYTGLCKRCLPCRAKVPDGTAVPVKDPGGLGVPTRWRRAIISARSPTRLSTCTSLCLTVVSDRRMTPGCTSCQTRRTICPASPACSLLPPLSSSLDTQSAPHLAGLRGDGPVWLRRPPARKTPGARYVLGTVPRPARRRQDDVFAKRKACRRIASSRLIVESSRPCLRRRAT